MLLHRPTSAYARAVSEISAVSLPADYFRACVQEGEAIRNFALSAMADRLTDVIELVEHITFCTLEQRLAGFLCCQFAGQFDRSLELAITHDQIASELGSAWEVVSRLLRDFERKGSVSLGRGIIRLNDINILKDMHNYRQH